MDHSKVKTEILSILHTQVIKDSKAGEIMRINNPYLNRNKP